MDSIKKDTNEFICRTETDSQTLRNLRLPKGRNFWLPKGTGGVWGCLGVWDGNVLKLGCDDSCTTINRIKFIEK